MPCSKKDCKKDRKKDPPSHAHKARNGESLAQKIAAEGAAFTKWCDQWDLEVIDKRGPALEVFRLSVIALVAGYKQFTLYLLSCLDEQGVQAVGQVTDAPEEEWRKRYQGWVTSFYQKMPKGRSKNELKERLKRYGEELRRDSVLIPKERFRNENTPKPQ